MASDNINGITTSRLLTNSNNIRNVLYSRNLYTPDVEYPLQDATTVDKVVGAINSIIAGITPFKSYNLKNTVYGRLIRTPTPLTEVGLIMLGKQFALNSMSHLAQQTFPVIKVSNLFDKNKNTKLFTLYKDIRITKKADDIIFENFLDKIFYTYPIKDYPFNKDPSNSDFIKNTGTGQLGFLYSAINKNIFKQGKNNIDKTFYDYAEKADTEIFSRSVILGGKDKKIGSGKDDKKFFDFNNKNFNPYTIFNISLLKSNSIVDANKNMINSLITDETYSSEYAPDNDFIKFYLGITNKTFISAFSSELENDWISSTVEFNNNNIENKLIWGRDGISPEATEKIKQLRGDDINIGNNNISGDLSYFNPFNLRSGLLEYTRNLLNATEGAVVDITRKAFTRNNNLVGFNGAGLWKANNSKYAQDAQISGKRGIRQHSVLDQYDRFVKAIRFNGNKVYGGNENSVIYNTVLPRIHPTINKKTGNIDNKNLMFSIENLAVRVISKGTYGIIDDEYGSPISACEVGPFNGRIMWFPPYNLELNETATAKFEPTVMVGRNEPMYNYINSERSATITFTLLVDYPPHLKNYKGIDKQKEIAEFFAFGGDNYVDKFVSVENYEARETALLKQIEDIKGSMEIVEPENITSFQIRIAFPNDIPRIGDNLNTIIDDLYIKYHYEIYDGCASGGDITCYSLNRDIFFITGLTDSGIISGKTIFIFNPSLLPANFSQYNQVGLYDEFGNCKLNNVLFRIFNDEKNRSLYSVYVVGGASKLYTEANAKDKIEGSEYNLALGKRRADAAKILVEKRLEAMFGKNINELGIEVTYDVRASTGDEKASDSNATAVAIPEEDTKNERYALIQIRKNERKSESKKPELSSDDITTIENITIELDAIRTKIRELKKQNNSCIYQERGSVDENGAGDTGILHGFQSVGGNYYYPVFHSQTPEDFHKRLTFLQQCTRQGSAIRNTATVDNNGILRAKNSVFGRQPICILRIGDFFYTKIIIENVIIDYNETTWDMNPEGFGMQPMIAKVTLQIKMIGGQSLKGPIDALQNAVSFNHYANSTFSNSGMYKLPSKVADDQKSYIDGILTTEQKNLLAAYETKVDLGKVESFE
jgi:hypothetical protein